VISPGLRPLLRLLRQLAEDDAAELRTFADALRSVCDTLHREGILDPQARSGDELRSTVTDPWTRATSSEKVSPSLISSFTVEIAASLSSRARFSEKESWRVLRW